MDKEVSGRSAPNTYPKTSLARARLPKDMVPKTYPGVSPKHTQMCSKRHTQEIKSRCACVGSAGARRTIESVFIDEGCLYLKAT